MEGPDGRRNKWLDFSSNMDYNADFTIKNWEISQYTLADFDEIFKIALKLYKERLIYFLLWSGSLCWLYKSGIWAILR